MPRLDLSRVRREPGASMLAEDAEVDAVERQLGVPMPAGYREYVTTLGEGALDMLVRVLPPTSIIEQLEEHRGRFAGGWYWEDDGAGFDQDAAMTSIPIADTLDGDVIALWPDDPSRLYILPRHEDRLIVRAADLLEVVEWICAGGLGHAPSEERTFTPMASADGAPLPRPEEVDDGGPPPDLGRPPRSVLLAYFAELEAVESWAAAQIAFPSALAGADAGNDQTDALITRSARVHARYGTPRFAAAMRGGSVTITGGRRQEHDARGIRVLEETALDERRVRIRAVHGDGFGTVNDYVLERSQDEWRIASTRLVDVIVPSHIGFVARIRGWLGKG